MQKIQYNLQLCFCHLINSYIICNILVFIFLGFGKIECRIQITTTHGFLILIFPKSYTMCVHYNFFIIFTTKMFLKSKKDTRSHILERSLQKDFNFLFSLETELSKSDPLFDVALLEQGSYQTTSHVRDSRPN